MAGAQEKLDTALAELRRKAAALERIEAGGAAVEQATAKIRAFVQEADELRITLRLNYSELNDAIKREKQSRTAWQTFVDRLGTASLAVMLWALVQYLFARFQ